MPHVLIIEDEEDILALVHYNFIRNGYRADLTTSGEDGLAMARQLKPDLIILDLMLPGIDGLEICRRLKEEKATRMIPIIMLTAKGEEEDIVKGLEIGADDYIPKPFSPQVLLARAKTVLRRIGSSGSTEKDAPIEIGELMIHPGRNEVRIDDQPINLTFTEFQVLALLARRPGWVFTRGQIVDAVRGEDYAVTERSVDVQIVGLRKKLKSFGSYIETVRGIGYRFKDQE
ncbi:MAG: DNA-binding response regulator [Desulfuromonas sp.]|nr:MAG: DNA-binding response regulator [Desulfuromonas sp.]